MTSDAVSKPVVEFHSAGKAFLGGKRALEPTTLTVGPGEFLCVIGPSGCGKSTLLKLAAGLHAPSEGRILWWGDGFDRIGGCGRRVAFVFQDPTLMPWATVAANVRLPLGLAGVHRDEAEVRAVRALEQVELGARATELPHRLSGGMKMRVSIARALVVDPDLILMDEPFGALDEFSRNRLNTDLLALASARRFTTLFVTHSIYEAVFLATRVVVMAGQPGRLFVEFMVDEPQPRSEEFRTSDRFVRACCELSGLLRDAALDSRPAAP